MRLKIAWLGIAKCLSMDIFLSLKVNCSRPCSTSDHSAGYQIKSFMLVLYHNFHSHACSRTKLQ